MAFGPSRSVVPGGLGSPPSLPADNELGGQSRRHRHSGTHRDRRPGTVWAVKTAAEHPLPTVTRGRVVCRVTRVCFPASRSPRSTGLGDLPSSREASQCHCAPGMSRGTGPRVRADRGPPLCGVPQPARPPSAATSRPARNAAVHRPTTHCHWAGVSSLGCSEDTPLRVRDTQSETHSAATVRAGSHVPGSWLGRRR